jgi:preprotein translocase subunit SecD
MLMAMGVVAVLLGITIALGRSPELGLDLRGGVSVNLQPVKDGEVTDDVDDEQLDQAIAIIRKRVDALGVAEPEVSRQGNTITVQIPGATNQQQVLDIVGQTAELRFRPVLAFLGPRPSGKELEELQASVEQLRGELTMPEGVTAQQVVEDEQAKLMAQAGLTDPSAIDPTTGAPLTVPTETTAVPTTEAPPTTAAPGTTIDPTSGNGGSRSVHRRGQTDTTAPPTTAAGDTTTTTVPPVPLNQWGVDINDERFGELYQAELQIETDVTDPADDKADQEVVLLDTEGNAYRLGPTLLTGRAVEDADAGISSRGEWVVNPVFREGKDGIDLFNSAAALCFNGDPTCPATTGEKGAMAIVLDSEVLTAPSINEATFARDAIEISGSFEQDSAREVAVALRFGSLPIELEPQQAETVSATLGEGALQAGIIAGAIGLVAVFAFLFLYYRMLTLLTLASLCTSAALLWVIMSWVGATVTLAGVVGLVVSIGIALDSCVVSFEGLKEDVRRGATVRSVAERSMVRSYSTVVKADASSLIGAVVLYWLSVGPVRGFAFYLGAATLLDLISAFFVVRPGVLALTRSEQGRHPTRLGIPIDDLPEATQEKVAALTKVGA